MVCTFDHASETVCVLATMTCDVPHKMICTFDHASETVCVLSTMTCDVQHNMICTFDHASETVCVLATMTCDVPHKRKYLSVYFNNKTLTFNHFIKPYSIDEISKMITRT